MTKIIVLAIVRAAVAVLIIFALVEGLGVGILDAFVLAMFALVADLYITYLLINQAAQNAQNSPPCDPPTLSHMGHMVKISSGGVQEKVVLVDKDGNWYEILDNERNV